jgi:hypothetical protein
MWDGRGNLVKQIDGAGLSKMLLTYPNSTGSGYAVSNNTRNEGMRLVRPLGIQGREDNVREQCYSSLDPL